MNPDYGAAVTTTHNGQPARDRGIMHMVLRMPASLRVEVLPWSELQAIACHLQI